MYKTCHKDLQIVELNFDKYYSLNEIIQMIPEYWELYMLTIRLDLIPYNYFSQVNTEESLNVLHAVTKNI